MKPKKNMMKMKRVLVPWFFFIICCEAVSCSSAESTSLSEAASPKQSRKGQAKSNLMHTSFFIKSTSVPAIFLILFSIFADGYEKFLTKSNKGDVHSRRAYNGKSIYEVVHLRNNVDKGKEEVMIKHHGRKANKGVYGGGSQYRPKKSKGAASPLLLKSSSFLSVGVLRTLTVGLFIFGLS